MKRQIFNRLISNAAFPELFITEMGWNNPAGTTKLPPIEIESVIYQSNIVAEKSGYKILVCEVDTIPTTSVCRRIDLKVRNFANDYILIFVQRAGFHHLWLAPVRKVDKRDIVTTEYTTADQAEFLFQKVDNLAFAFDEAVTIVDVRERVQESFAVNSEKITKDFYVGFKKEHKAFVEFIHGIEGTESAAKDRQWYASVMLNRLMFCYFIQKKGFLDGDKDYLQNKLHYVRRERGAGHFFRSFYLGFLCELFHGGLNAPCHDARFEDIYGRIPYLNGGMFDEHQIERDYDGIDIDDEAFERLFNFFDKWNWHLDTRITASGKDINPDVLGYIFEQYINDRAQMGAYYTKEDITEYIGRNCILPFLFDSVSKSTVESAGYFAPTGYVWQMLRQSGDRYIFDAVKHGYDCFDEIPPEIARGIITEDMRREYSETSVGDLPDTHVPLSTLRCEWNSRTPERWGLPTEIWRETIERLQRCRDILGKINGGEITSINDFITYNLDIRAFAADLLMRADHRFVGWFYHALQRVTILDPTCGSGAFLFAAMNILEPLYEICIDRMEEAHRRNPALFKDELAEITDRYRSNIQYFIYKSIILRNLYGVDIMVEATEIAKLRLFLKMVAVVDVDRRADNLGLDPLPDIDFNIRCGNTLVGYANKAQLEYDLSHAEDILQMLANDEFKKNIDEEMKKVARAYELFKSVQISQDEDIVTFKRAKNELNERLAVLNDKLNRRLFSAGSFSQDISKEDLFKSAEYHTWLTSHQPFHWLAEFYQIIEGNHGFDVIIGNPPYLEKKQIGYRIEQYKTWDSGAVHSMCIERCLAILKGSLSMIVPIALICTQRMVVVQKLLEEEHSMWYSNFAWRPAHLFDNVSRALTIFVAHKTESKHNYCTNYIKWRTEYRNILFPCVWFVEYSIKRNSFWMPKFGNEMEKSILSKILSSDSSISYFISPQGRSKVYYRTTGGVYWKTITTWSPKFFCNGVEMKSSRETSISFSNNEVSTCIAGLLSSNTFWWWYTITANLRDLNPSDIFGFKFPREVINHELYLASSKYLHDIDSKSIMQIRMQKTKGETKTQLFKIGASKNFIDEIDAIIALNYGFSELELDYILQYDIKYRIRSEEDE